MTELAPVAQILHQYGPWALVVLFGLAIRFLYHEVGAANARTIAMAERIIPLVEALRDRLELLRRKDRESS